MDPIREKKLKAVVHRLELDQLMGVHAAPLALTAPQNPTRNPQPRPTAIPAAISSATIESRISLLRELDDQQVKVCRKCNLCQTRTKTVFGQGNAGARLVFVGEAPGHDEDMQGLAFVGKAGQLLTKMIEAMGLTRDQVYICNILKCRPPDNRDPAPDEISSCWPYLDQQLRIVQPEVIVTLGKPASQTLLRTTEGIGRLRGNWHEYYTSGSPSVGEPTALMPTFHPAYLLRSPGEKVKAWSDLKMVMARLDLPLPR
jgi:uracil-DNA glycosylase